MGNNRRRFKVVLYCMSRRIYKIDLQSTLFSKYISSNIVCVMDVYIDFCMRLNRKITPFHDNGLFVPSADYDAMSANCQVHFHHFYELHFYQITPC